jgi:hypothetical protein
MQGVTLGTIVGIIIQAVLNFVPGLGGIVSALGGVNLGGLALSGASAASGAIAGGVASATGSATSAANKAVGGIISGGLSSAVGALMPLINGGGFDLMSVLGALVSGGVGGGILGAIVPGKK